MPLSFPNSPVIDQIHTTGNKVFKWDGVKWINFKTPLVGEYVSDVRVQEDILQKQFVGDSSWINILDLSSLLNSGSRLIDGGEILIPTNPTNPDSSFEFTGEVYSTSTNFIFN